MTINYKRVVWICILVTIVPLSGYSSMKKIMTSEKMVYKNHKITVVYKYKQKNKPLIKSLFNFLNTDQNSKKDQPLGSPLSNLMDSNRNTTWSFYGSNYKHEVSGCSGEIYFKFDEPVKIKSIKINMNKYSENSPKELFVNLYYGDELGLVGTYGGWYEYHIKKTSNISLNIRNSIYTPDFFIKTLSIDFTKCYKNLGKAIINDINIEFLKNDSFTPTKTFRDIKILLNNIKIVEKLNKNGIHGKLWRVKDKIKDQDVIIDNLRRHLIYYALNGNKEAEKLFLTDVSRYKEIEGVYGRDDFGLNEWYSFSKKALRKKLK